MNIKIRTFFLLLGAFLLLLFGLSIYFFFELKNNSKELKNIEYNRYIMIEKADELRQSSDDLTRFARTYAVTADPKYKEIYFKILAIRNGEQAKPQEYHQIYWDLSEPIRAKRHSYGQKDSLNNEMKNLPYNQYEFQKLQESHSNSDQLVNLEIEAFNAMSGLYKDQNGAYTLKAKPNQQRAIQLLYSEEYHRAKEKIMLPIDEFLTSLNARTLKMSTMYNQKIEKIFQNIFTVIGIGILIFVITIFMLMQKVYFPIDSLTKAIAAFRNGEKKISEFSHYDDEIGMMIRQFFIMKNQLNVEYNKIEELSQIDQLTNIYNRRALFEITKELLKLTQRNKEPLSLLMIDIDLFKKVNDTYGHLIGDEVLKHLVKYVRNGTRDSDLFARYGGEEFIVVLANTDINGALAISEKIRILIEASPYIDETTHIPITISIGVTQYHNDPSLQTIIERADKALYLAKEHGRNKVESIA